MFEEKNRRRGFAPHIEQVAGNAQKDRRTRSPEKRRFVTDCNAIFVKIDEFDIALAFVHYDAYVMLTHASV
jgi:hypothetical protein